MDTSRLTIVSSITLQGDSAGFTIPLFDICESSTLGSTMALVLNPNGRQGGIKTVESNGVIELHRRRHVYGQWWHRAGEFVINTGPTGLLGAARPQPSGEGTLMSQRLQEEAWCVTSHYVFLVDSAPFLECPYIV